MNEIASAQNPKYRRWLSLLEAKGIKKEGLALISGDKLVREWIAQSRDSIEDLLLPPKAEALDVDLPRQTRLTAPLFKMLDVIGTGTPLAVVRIPQLEVWNPAGA